MLLADVMPLPKQQLEACSLVRVMRCASANHLSTCQAWDLQRHSLFSAEGVNAPVGIRAHPLLWKPPSDGAQQQQGIRADGSTRAPAGLPGFSTPQKAALTSHDNRCPHSRSSQAVTSYVWDRFLNSERHGFMRATCSRAL